MIEKTLLHLTSAVSSDGRRIPRAAAGILFAAVVISVAAVAIPLKC
jgi:hypothetical protein